MAAVDAIRKMMFVAYDDIEVSVPYEFLSSYFGKNADEELVGSVEAIDIDIRRDYEQVAVDVIRGAGAGTGKDNLLDRYSTKEFTPPLYWEETPITAAMINKRLPGRSPFQPTNAMEAFAQLGVKAQIEQTRKIRRAIEWQASQIFLNGSITWLSGGATQNIVFNRKSTHAVTPGTSWSNAAATPLNDVQGLCDAIRQDSHIAPDTIIMGETTVLDFLATTQIKNYLGLWRLYPGDVTPKNAPAGAVFWGRIAFGSYMLNLYTYPQFYQTVTFNPSTGLNSVASSPYVTATSAIVFNSTARLVKAWGAVEVLPYYEDVYRMQGLPAIPDMVQRKFVPFAYDLPPATSRVGVQSAPLLIPVAIDTIGVLLIL
jgi:hypothetical protein